MKFESEFGLGEICRYNQADNAREAGGRSLLELMVKVVFVTFDQTGDCTYMVEHAGHSFGMQRFNTTGESLTGDPDFDQEIGMYLAEE